MFEDDGIGRVEVFRHIHHYRSLFQLPKGIEDTIGNDHDIGLVLILLGLVLALLLARLMHVSEHFQGGWAGRDQEIAEDMGLLLVEIA